jgi:RNA polymerase sigma-70 factor (ECF subfamily)
LPDHRREFADPVAELDVCIRVALPALPEEDREILEACDLGLQTQEEYADRKAISLPAAKARIRRARERLRSELTRRCNVIMDDSGKVCCHGAGFRNE